MILVNLRQAERHDFIGRVGFTLPFSHVGKMKWSASEPPDVFARSQSSRMAAQAFAFNGITRSPASVFVDVRRTVKARSMKFTSRQHSPFTSQLRMVVFRASIIARRALHHSGRTEAFVINLTFSSYVRTRAARLRTGSGLISSASTYQRLALFKIPRRTPSSRLIVLFDAVAALRPAMYCRMQSAEICVSGVTEKYFFSGFALSFSV